MGKHAVTLAIKNYQKRTLIHKSFSICPVKDETAKVPQKEVRRAPTMSPLWPPHSNPRPVEKGLTPPDQYSQALKSRGRGKGDSAFWLYSKMV